ncbi:MAG: hypothetical protein KBH06_12935 [Spirochaetes bacterium]|nr:hypothetical protein [Spirochaetota bacterium]
MEYSDKKLIRDIRKQAGKTIFKYQMLDQNDHVLAGLSGGKDSLAMIDILAEKMRRIPVKFKTTAAYIELAGIPNKIDPLRLKEFCEERSVGFIHRMAEIDLTRDEAKDRCYVCALHRRNSLFKLARELNCAKLALGHNLDDMISTLLMNMSYHGNISTMPANVSLFGGELHIIRPLAEIEEEDIAKYAELLDLGVQISPCPFNEGENRHFIKKLLNELAQKNPHAKTNIYRSMGRIKTDYLS